MKKAFALLLCLLMLTGCGKHSTVDEQMITCPPLEAAPVTGTSTRTESVSAEAQDAPVVVAALGNYTFVTGGVELVPGTAFDPGILPQAQSVYEVPSCAIVGTDNLYNYGSFELTAFDDGTGEVIYSILLTDPNITTTEGLALGDSTEKLTQIYGSNYTEQGSSRIYSGDAEQLILILQNDTVASIEYRMIVK